MAHFAQLDENNRVARVIRVLDEHLVDENGVEQEQNGIAFLNELFGTELHWVQTSYSGKFRGNYASMGGYYVPDKDLFSPPQPFPSWSFGSGTAQWEPPVPHPQDGQEYFWNEEELCWLPVDSGEAA